ncbi:DUF418 domain-containing protein [Antribacter gilvus]|uniref:DUF418 domain-containing protein n=1 Tax=Antribacter gilvus TaxID=2304675 RepID=UPI00197D329D|nr:DUF418 domain-containing protein [Antribacter gilvus]
MTRLVSLDVIRGFALCGILIANVIPISASVASDTAVAVAVTTSGSGGADWLHLLVDLRFVPIFSLLFGVGFSLLVDSAATRTARPRLALLRRLLVLLAFGLAHLFLLWPGDILTVYAAVGLLVLLPSTWLPRRVVAGLAVACLAAALLLGAGHFALVPGLFLLGSAATRYGVTRRIEDSTGGPALLALGLAAGAVPALWAQASYERAGDVGTLGYRIVYPLAGLLLAGVYVCVLLVLLRSPARPALRAVFAPLGKLALTNYLTATIVVLGVATVVGHPERWTSTTVLVIAGTVLAAQWLFSTLWLRHFEHGPLEWAWRWATWLRRPAPSAVA